MPLHRHRVQLTVQRFELELALTPATDWELALRIPWSEKRQVTHIERVDPATPAQIDAMERNSQIHHATATYRSIEDLQFLATRRGGKSSCRWRVGWGVSLPTGITRSDPYLLGDAGQPHVHLQSGTGTLDPLLEFGVYRPLGTRLGLDFSATGRAPLYTNSRGYRGPPEGSAGLLLLGAPSPNFAWRLGAVAGIQGDARWHGRVDPNSGVLALRGAAGISWTIPSGTALRLDLIHPVYQRLKHGGDAFRPGTTLVLGIGFGGRK